MKIPIAIALTLATSACVAQIDTRLLPASYTEKLNISWTQDGRVVDIKVTNPGSTWVIEELLLQVSYPLVIYNEKEYKKFKEAPPSPQKAATGKAAAIDWKAGPISSQQSPTDHPIKVVIQPGKSADANFDLPPDIKLESITIQEARGREPTTWEKLSRKLR
jgi:hypothetical protein